MFQESLFKRRLYIVCVNAGSLQGSIQNSFISTGFALSLLLLEALKSRQHSRCLEGQTVVS